MDTTEYLRHILSLALGAFLLLIYIDGTYMAAPAGFPIILALFYPPIVVSCFRTRTVGSFVKQVLLHSGLFGLPIIFYDRGFALRGIPLLTVIGLVVGLGLRSIVRARRQIKKPEPVGNRPAPAP